jgi:hypothetical protein
MELTPKLNKALIEARVDIHNPQFDSQNPHFKSRFASLKAVIASVIPPLADHGIAVIQDLQTVEGGIACYTHLLHESGEEKTYGPLIMRATKQDPQGYASASTYARRYHLQAVGGVVGDDDDDGNSASESNFTSVAARSKLRNKLLKAIDEGDDQTVVQLSDEMDNDQKAEMWGLFNAPQKKQLKEAKERFHEAEKADE